MTNWITEAERFEELPDEAIFINRNISQFLQHDRVFWIISSKGMGKTLLLRYKRKLADADARKSGFVTLPEGRASLDYVHLPESLPEVSIRLLEDVRFWNDIWQASLCISIFMSSILYHIDSSEESRIMRRISRIKNLEPAYSLLMDRFNGRQYGRMPPSRVLVELLNSGQSSLEKLRRYYLQVNYDLYTTFIRSGVNIFIDSFDQALSSRFPDSLDIWIAGQLGLLTAAWEISRQNPHIKIYTAIRQEAYSGFQGETRMSMQGSVLLLKYDIEELSTLLNQSVKYFEKKSSLSELVGLEYIKNTHAEEDENAFRYLYRHSIGTPRSIVVIAKDVAIGTKPQEDVQIRVNSFRRLVNQTAANEICRDYLLAEMRPFIPCLNSEGKIRKFAKLFRNNVLTTRMLQVACKDFNGSKERIHDCANCERDHPFCALYNIGLLGIIECDPGIQREETQVFRKPYEYDRAMKSILPQSRYYIIHPSLNHFIHQNNKSYRAWDMVIGDGCSWKREYDNKIDSRKVKIFISYASKDSKKVVRIVERMEEELSKKGLYCDIWFDRWKIRGGDWIQEKIEDGLANSRCLLLMLSKNSTVSGWVEREWRNRYEEEIREKRPSVIPIFVDQEPDETLPELLRGKRVRSINTSSLAKFTRDVQAISTDIEQRWGGDQN